MFDPLLCNSSSLPGEEQRLLFWNRLYAQASLQNVGSCLPVPVTKALRLFRYLAAHVNKQQGSGQGNVSAVTMFMILDYT